MELSPTHARTNRYSTQYDTLVLSIQRDCRVIIWYTSPSHRCTCMWIKVTKHWTAHKLSYYLRTQTHKRTTHPHFPQLHFITQASGLAAVRYNDKTSSGVLAVENQEICVMFNGKSHVQDMRWETQQGEINWKYIRILCIWYGLLDIFSTLELWRYSVRVGVGWSKQLSKMLQSSFCL